MFALGTKAWIAVSSTVVLVGAIVAGVAIASQDEFEPVPAPQWKPGYRFSYDVTADIAQTNDGLEEYGLPVSTDFSVGPIPVKKEVLNTADYRDPDGQPVYISAATFPLSNLQSGLPILEGVGEAPAFLTAERQSDLAPIPVVPDFTCSSSDCAGGGIKFLSGNPLTYLPFTLTADERSEQTGNLPIPIPMEEFEDVTRVIVVEEVSGLETVDLPTLGSTEAVRVDISYYPDGLQEVMRDMVRQAEQAGIQVDRFNLDLGVHEIVHYSEAYQAVVQHQYIMHALVDIAVSGEFQGQEFEEDFYAEFDAHITAVLTGAEYTTTEEQTPLQILQKVSNADLIGDARGKSGAISLADYSLRLDASHDDINVADGQPVRFSADVSGAGLPEGHHLVYEVRDATGATVASDAFDGVFEVLLEEPGVYSVSARAIDQHGTTVTSASRYVAADLETVLPGRCSFTLTGSACDADEKLAVAPGARSLVVEAYQYNIAPPLNQWLEVRAPEGTAQSSGSDARVQLDASDLEELGFGKYSLFYSNYGDHLGATDFYVNLDYEVPGSSVVVDPESGNSSGGYQGPPAVIGDMLQAVDAGLDLGSGELRVDLGRLLG